MSAEVADALALVGVLAVFGAVAIVLREAFRPELSSHWGEREFGDQPEIPVFHSPSIVSEAQRDHGL